MIFINTTPLVEVPILNVLEMFISDVRLKLTMPNGVDDRVVIADIDEQSIGELGRWPWNRALLADFTDIMFDHYQVKVLGFDVIFSEPDEVSGLKVLKELDSLGIKDKNYQRVSGNVNNKLENG